MALRTLVMGMDKVLEEGLEFWVTCGVHSSLTFTGV